MRVSRYEPPHVFGFVARDPNFGNATHEFTFAERDGGVLIVRTMTLGLHPIVAFFFRFMIYPLIGKPAMRRSMTALKMKLEQYNRVSSS